MNTALFTQDDDFELQIYDDKDKPPWRTPPPLPPPGRGEEGQEEQEGRKNVQAIYGKNEMGIAISNKIDASNDTIQLYRQPTTTTTKMPIAPRRQNLKVRQAPETALLIPLPNDSENEEEEDGEKKALKRAKEGNLLKQVIDDQNEAGTVLSYPKELDTSND
ncbi:uncharacterized protein TRUGW13939_11712 [Talaromyces rugulosus]|uniref:Uncharacterized protein n=1 Tax=Talaromyces rugulosus TaxID=121627 RepID=A0A7H8REJ9_TALRU|nr:uncharacterized protein TRUGW13939_11712 [Talaromyces rugulosus]QKX64537.1 hypothetical protein TRUGW13939_11712 [Talaromyces rugulosus]